MSEILLGLETALAGKYAIEKELGAGGMARVYLAEDLKHRRKVAVKVLRPELAALVGQQRFLSEIEVTASLDHPHVLTLIDSGESGGFLWYVVPFVRGESLRQRLEREALLGIDDVLAISQQIASALDHAHTQGVVHRDIKPENILLHEGVAMLADFGIALALREAGGQRLTETGLSIGTPEYMSPEQATGDRVLDRRSDVYSLAAVIYEMLVGEPPHTGATTQAVIAKLITTLPTSLRVIRPSLPLETDLVLQRGLAKVREDRYPTAGALVEALRAALLKSPGAGLEPVGSRSASLVPVRRRWLWATGLTVVLMAAFLLVRGRQRLAPGGEATLDPHRVAVLYFQRPESNDSLELLADGLTEGLITALAQVPELEVVSRNGVRPFRGRDVSRDSTIALLRAGTLIEGAVEPTGHRVRVTVRLVDANSEAEFQRASFEAPTGAWLVTGDSLSSRVVDFLRSRLGAELRLREQRARTRSVDAWLSLQRAERARSEARVAAESGAIQVATGKFAVADSFARVAGIFDQEWAEPIVFRASIFYQRSRLELANPLLAGRLIDQGLAIIDTALRLDADDADALEVRGDLQYWKYLLRLEPDAAAAAVLRQRARADLELATRLKPSQAGAWASLSHLYGNDPSGSLNDVVFAARRAYEADAYLANAPTIIQRLFFAYYDLDQAVDAAHWCEEGGRRYPSDIAFTTCRLYLMTMRGEVPDPGMAWELAGRVARLQSSPFDRAEARMMVAGVLARAGLRDSARVVARSALAGSEVDPTRFLSLQQAFVLTVAEDTAGAVEALKAFLTANPERRVEFAGDPGWKFRGLVGNSAFRRLVGAR